MIRGTAAAAVLLLCGCTTTGAPSASPTPRTTSPAPSAEPVPVPVPALASLTCGDPIDGDAPPAGFETVLGAVALPTSAAYPALQAADSGDPTAPALFAKTGLLVRAGRPFELEVPAVAGNRLGIGWGNGLTFRPSTRFAVPACPDVFGTGWVAYPGGYWADRPLCLLLTVRAGGAEQEVHIGIGRPCPGQRAPANP